MTVSVPGTGTWILLVRARRPVKYRAEVSKDSEANLSNVDGGHDSESRSGDANYIGKVCFFTDYSTGRRARGACTARAAGRPGRGNASAQAVQVTVTLITVVGKSPGAVTVTVLVTPGPPARRAGLGPGG